jgi:hypothetical protein
VGKYFGYLLLLLLILLALEWFQVVDVPFLEIPDYMGGKSEMVNSTEQVLDQMK